MNITYTLYCKECFSRYKRKFMDEALKINRYSSYFCCSECSLETDRGYAVAEITQKDQKRVSSTQYRNVEIA